MHLTLSALNRTFSRGSQTHLDYEPLLHRGGEQVSASLQRALLVFVTLEEAADDTEWEWSHVDVLERKTARPHLRSSKEEVRIEEDAAERRSNIFLSLSSHFRPVFPRLPNISPLFRVVNSNSSRPFPEGSRLVSLPASPYRKACYHRPYRKSNQRLARWRTDIWRVKNSRESSIDFIHSPCVFTRIGASWELSY